MGTALTPFVLSMANANILNGGFEDGLNGWTVTVNGSANPITVTSGTTNASAGTINPSITGDNYIYTSQSSPGNSFISQNFLVEGGTNQVFFDIAINNGAGSYSTPNSLSYSGSTNQQARFDILAPGSALDTLDPNDIIVTAYQTQIGDPATQDWTTVSVDVTTELTPYIGQNVIFRFVQVDNQGYFNLALDNINVGQTQFAGSSYFVPVSGNSVTFGAATVLDGLVTGGGPLPADFDAALTTLSGLSEGPRADALKKTTPNTSATVTNVTSQVLQGGINEIGGRINAVQSYQPTGANGGESLSAVKNTLLDPNSFWGQATAYKGNQDLEDSFAGYESFSRGLMMGYDVTPTEDSVLGIAFGYTNTDIDMQDFRSGDNAEIDSYQLSLYGSYQFRNEIILDVVGSYARHEYEGTRATGVDTASAEFGADHYGIRFDASRLYDLEKGIVIRPKAGLEVTHLRQEGYAETNSALGQSYDDESVNRVRSHLSVEVAKEVTLESETTVVPKLRLGWKHEFNDDGMDSTSRFIGGGSEFTTQGQAVDRDTFNLRAGVDIFTQNSMQIEASVEGDLAEDYEGFGGHVKAKWAF